MKRIFATVADHFFAMLPSKTAIGGTVIPGSNFEFLVGGTTFTMARENGVDFETICDDPCLRPDKGDNERVWASNAKAQRPLDWELAHGALECIARRLREAAAWFSMPENWKWSRVDI